MKEYKKLSDEEIKQLAIMRQRNWVGKNDTCARINNYMIILRAVNPDLTEDEAVSLAMQYYNKKDCFND